VVIAIKISKNKVLAEIISVIILNTYMLPLLTLCFLLGCKWSAVNFYWKKRGNILKNLPVKAHTPQSGEIVIVAQRISSRSSDAQAPVFTNRPAQKIPGWTV